LARRAWTAASRRACRLAYNCRTVGSVPREAVESTIGDLRVRVAGAWFIMDW
jgi:hypothetical protein